nr:TPA_asm: m88.6 sORF 3 [Murid betaherpesvirus 1]DBA07846.1 TPA_asm: m88.6 sORF 3 [Murid betaherpesvirus 1]
MNEPGINMFAVFRTSEFSVMKVGLWRR